MHPTPLRRDAQPKAERVARPSRRWRLVNLAYVLGLLLVFVLGLMLLPADNGLGKLLWGALGTGAPGIR
ncbi:hypothetical protein [Pseudomonas sp.]|uniref:hypothetical protein n=1 Tax=Pseudomonas sp. TaxID=306 RepID=UPI0028A75E9E|nr:hypothetical protein [Pseudomonas sp.]